MHCAQARGTLQRLASNAAWRFRRSCLFAESMRARTYQMFRHRARILLRTARGLCHGRSLFGCKCVMRHARSSTTSGPSTHCAGLCMRGLRVQRVHAGSSESKSTLPACGFPSSCNCIETPSVASCATVPFCATKASVALGLKVLHTNAYVCFYTRIFV